MNVAYRCLRLTIHLRKGHITFVQKSYYLCLNLEPYTHTNVKQAWYKLCYQVVFFTTN